MEMSAIGGEICYGRYMEDNGDGLGSNGVSGRMENRLGCADRKG